MGHQLTYWIIPAECGVYERRAMTTVASLLISSESRINMPTVIEPGEGVVGETSWLAAYVVPQWLLKNVQMVRVKNRESETWAVDGLRSPVVQLIRPILQAGSLKPGRLFYDSGCWDESRKWIDWGDVFVDWAQQVFKKYKTGLTRDARSGDWYSEQGEPYLRQIQRRTDVIRRKM